MPTFDRSRLFGRQHVVAQRDHRGENAIQTVTGA
jgi:hypothetical protein